MKCPGSSFHRFTSCIVLSEVIILEVRKRSKQGFKPSCSCVHISHFSVSQTKSLQILTILRQSLKSESDTVEFMGNLKVAKASGFSNECKLFVRGCGCASFDYICYSRLIKTSRQAAETVRPSEFMISPRSTSASEKGN